MPEKLTVTIRDQTAQALDAIRYYMPNYSTAQIVNLAINEMAACMISNARDQLDPSWQRRTSTPQPELYLPPAEDPEGIMYRYLIPTTPDDNGETAPPLAVQPRLF